MLTRRNLFKFAATFGLGVFAPRFEQLASGAAVESRQGKTHLRSVSSHSTNNRSWIWNGSKISKMTWIVWRSSRMWPRRSTCLLRLKSI